MEKAKNVKSGYSPPTAPKSPWQAAARALKALGLGYKRKFARSWDGRQPP